MIIMTAKLRAGNYQIRDPLKFILLLINVNAAQPASLIN